MGAEREGGKKREKRKQKKGERDGRNTSQASVIFNEKVCAGRRGSITYTHTHTHTHTFS